jgi:dTDP-4-amino-4,6-dideoxygalactose transaminase
VKVPFLDLQAQYHSIRPEILAAVEEVLQSGAYSGGRFVERFEEDFARFCGSPDAIGVANGTDALHLIFRALGIGPGDEVITVAATFAATAEAIRLAGATPVFVDVDPVTYTMDPGKIPAALTRRTRAIVPVHLFGQTADMGEITRIAGANGVPVVEDACQAHGADWNGARAGTLGTAAAFSFYPGKNLGAYGEAGAVTTGSAKLAESIRSLRNHGQVRKNEHEVLGWNARMDGIQGAILSVKLRHLEQWTEDRRRKAARYMERLAGWSGGIVAPREASHGRHVWHLFVVRVDDRDRVLQGMEERGVQCGIHYPVPVHLQKPFLGSSRGKGSLPVSERCAAEFLSLPLYAEMSDEAVDFVCDCLTSLVRQPVGV